MWSRVSHGWLCYHMCAGRKLSWSDSLDLSSHAQQRSCAEDEASAPARVVGRSINPSVAWHDYRHRTAAHGAVGYGGASRSHYESAPLPPPPPPGCAATPAAAASGGLARHHDVYSLPARAQHRPSESWCG